ncbi:MAG TPA: hypothetical protein VGF80_15125 [Galbitalea sp.]
MFARTKIHIISAATAVLAIAALTGCSAVSEDAVLTAPGTSITASKASVGDTPPAPTGSTSFSYTSTKTVPGWTTRTDYSGCPAGWFVRLAQPDSWGDNTPQPSYFYTESSKLLGQTVGVGASVNTEYGSSGLFQNFEDEFTNFSVDTHHATTTIWCDKVPSWINTNTHTSSAKSADRPDAAIHATTKPTSSKKHGVGSITCYYCEFAGSLKNAQSNLYLTDSGMSSSAQTLTMAGNATGENVEYAEAASFGIWTTSGILFQNAVGSDGSQGSSISWQYSPNSIPSYGQFIMNDHGAGSSNYGMMLVLASSVSKGTPGTTGSGGLCLAGSGSGAQPTLQPCDATDVSQYWSMQ